MATFKTDKEMLMESINSILNQTYTNFEFIIVCDGDEEEYNFIKKIDDKRIKVLKNSENMGLPYSLNKAITAATGNYIARMDSDDISLPNRLKIQLDFLESHPDVFLCSTYVKQFGAINDSKKILFNNCEQVKCQLLYRAVLVHPTVMGRKEVFQQFKYNNEFKCSQDFELWSRISEKYKIAVIPSIQLNYRVHNKQASIEKMKIQEEFSKKIIYENSKKINGKYEEQIFECLCVLGGREKLTKENYLKISNEIDYIIEQNKKYKNYGVKELKMILYNRFFELILKNKIFVFNFSVLKKCLKFYNLKDILFKLG